MISLWTQTFLIKWSKLLHVYFIALYTYWMIHLCLLWILSRTLRSTIWDNVVGWMKHEMYLCTHRTQTWSSAWKSKVRMGVLLLNEHASGARCHMWRLQRSLRELPSQWFACGFPVWPNSFPISLWGSEIPEQRGAAAVVYIFITLRSCKCLIPTNSFLQSGSKAIYN